MRSPTALLRMLSLNVVNHHLLHFSNGYRPEVVRAFPNYASVFP